jgi:hypothetical protein
VVYRHAPQRTDLELSDKAISLVMDIGQGAGLSSASGARPFLPALLAGALARGDIGIDFDDSGWQFLESPGFLFAVLALGAIWYVAERSGTNSRVMGLGSLFFAVVLGALLFGGSLAEGGESAIPGIFAGAICAVVAFLAIDGLLSRAAKRLDDDAVGFLNLYADATALILAAIAIFVPPVSFLAIAAFLVVLLKGRASADRKYAGLRILR